MSQSISKAFLLAAGVGTRLKPLTDRIPKCLVPVDGEPVLSIWLSLCEQLGLREVLINTHHLADQVKAWASRQVGGAVRIRLAYEPELLGSAGTVAANLDFVGDQDDFFVFYADNLVRADFDALLRFHRSHDGPLTVALFHTLSPSNSGIARLDASGHITNFEEKPAHPQSDLANAGVYIARRELGRFLPARGFADFALDVFPRLAGEMRGFVIEGNVLDVGTPESYQETLREWPRFRRKPLPSGLESGAPVGRGSAFEMATLNYTAQYINEALQILGKIDQSTIDRVVDLLARVRENRGRIFFLGVGGGAGHASHAVNDFRKIAQIEAYTPTDNVSELTARVNDEGWDTSYANWLRGSRLQAKDMIFVFSVGGGDAQRRISANLVRALEYAKEVRATVCGVVGRDGGYTAQVADACVVVPTVNPATVTPHTESFQAVVWHLLVSHPKLRAAEMKWESVR